MSVTDRPKTGESTGRQISIWGTMLWSQLNIWPASYVTYRRIRKDPTIALARALSISPIVAGHWSVEADDDVPDEMVEFIQQQFLPIRQPLLTSALLGGIDFGHAAFEKVFGLDEDGLIELRKLKPLLPDITRIMVETDNGAFAGVTNTGHVLPPEKVLLIPFRVEGSNWYGEPLLENVRETYNEWRQANVGASRFDQKLAGTHLLVEYPPGFSEDQYGARRENSLIAAEICQSFEASGSLAVLRDMAPFVDKFGVDTPGWKISFLEPAGGQQPLFVDRLKYLDSLKCRALLVPERSVTEGQYGTKAEAGEQIDLALTNCDLVHQEVTRLVNWYAVDQLLALNWGESWRGKVRLNAAPVRDANLAFLREVYKAFLANPSGFMEEYGHVDTDSLKSELGIPKAKEVAQAGEETTAEEDARVGGGNAALKVGATGTAMRTVPLPGVEADAKVAATVRRIYNRLGIGG